MAIFGNLCLIIGAVLGNSLFVVVVAVEVLREFSGVKSFNFSVAKIGVSVGELSSNVVTAYASPISTDSYKFYYNFNI